MLKQANQPFSFPHFARLLFQHRRKAGIYALFFVVISFNLCLFLPANMHSPAAERMVNIIQLGCFTIMGIINVWLFYKRNFLAELSLSGAKLAFICLLFIVIALVLFVYYFISGNNGLIMAFASSAAFLLPFIIWQGWIEYMDIPASIYPLWYPSADEGGIAGTPLSAVNNIQVQLKILRRVHDTETNTFPVTTPNKTKLGRVFERFITDAQLHSGNSSIEITDSKQYAFGWRFYEEKWNGLYRRNLHPSKSLLENNIKANAKIAAVRTNEID